MSNTENQQHNNENADAVKEIKLGFIGGTGLAKEMSPDENTQRQVKTTNLWGKPSADLCVKKIEGHETALMFRHGPAHSIPPHQVNYRANVASLKEFGSSDVIAFCAIGSLREAIQPGSFVLMHQYINRTEGRPGQTFFEDNNLVAHVSMAEPTCGRLNELILEAARDVPGLVLHPKVVLLCSNGPYFSPRAESQLYRQWGADVIGMTTFTEAVLAREANLCYANIGMVTDYDSFDPTQPHVTQAQVNEVMKANSEKATRLMEAIVKRLHAQGGAVNKRPFCSCGCDKTMATAITTHGPYSETVTNYKNYKHLYANDPAMKGIL